MSDTTDRDTLADLIGDWINSANETAQEILDAGWRPPARVIETVEAAEALPAGSIILVLGPMPRAFARTFGGWHAAGPIQARLSTVGVMAGDSALLLWEPEVSDR